MESFLTCRMSGPLYELSGNPCLPWVILHYPIYFCLIPTLTGDTLRAGVSQAWVFSI